MKLAKTEDLVVHIRIRKIIQPGNDQAKTFTLVKMGNHTSVKIFDFPALQHRLSVSRNNILAYVPEILFKDIPVDGVVDLPKGAAMI